MKTLIFLFLLTLGIVQIAFAQNSDPPTFTANSGFGFRLGFNTLHTLDRNTSALLYRGQLPTLGLFYQNAKGGNQFQAQLKVGRGGYAAAGFPDRLIRFRSEDIYGKIDSVSVPMRGNSSLFQLSLAYLRAIDNSGPYRYQAGAELTNTLLYPEGFVQPGLMNIASLSPTFGMAYLPRERSYVSLRVTIPLISLVSRSTYNNSVSQPVDNKIVGFFDQGTQWDSWGKHREIRVAAAFNFRMGKRWMNGIHYDFNLMRNASPRDLTVSQSELGFSMQLVR